MGGKIVTSKKYNRYFIIFQEEDKGFGIALDKQPTGYTKIETRNGKCKITVYVQNLIKGKGPYICCMIDGSKNPAVVARLGEITVDETGRGETFWEYKEEDIAGTGMTIDKFLVSAVIVEGDKILSPLTGYASKEKIEWREKLSRENKKDVEEKIEKEEVKEEEIDDDARKFIEYEEKIKEQAQREDSKEENKEDNDEREEIEKEKDYDDEVYEMTRGDKNEVKRRRTHANVFHKILKDFEEAYEICDDLKGYRWWKIPFREEYETVQDSNYPYYCTIYHPLMAYPYINYIKYIKKTGHYYFGIKYDENGEVKVIAYGIEGKFSTDEQPYMGMTGFAKWFTIKGKDTGIWTMFYNPYTGCIMIPKS